MTVLRCSNCGKNFTTANFKSEEDYLYVSRNIKSSDFIKNGRMVSETEVPRVYMCDYCREQEPCVICGRYFPKEQMFESFASMGEHDYTCRYCDPEGFKQAEYYAIRSNVESLLQYQPYSTQQPLNPTYQKKTTYYVDRFSINELIRILKSIREILYTYEQDGISNFNSYLNQLLGSQPKNISTQTISKLKKEIDDFSYRMSFEMNYLSNSEIEELVRNFARLVEDMFV